MNEREKNMVEITQKEAAEMLRDELLERGVPNVEISDLAREDWAECVEDAFRYDKLVLATTTYNSDIFPFMRQFIDHLTERDFQKRTVAFIENGSWAPTAAKVMKKMFEGSKDITFTDTTVKIISAMNDENKQQIESLAEELCRAKAIPAPVRYPMNGLFPRPVSRDSTSPDSAKELTAPVILSRPEKRMPKPTAIFPMDFACLK